MTVKSKRSHRGRVRTRIKLAGTTPDYSSANTGTSANQSEVEEGGGNTREARSNAYEVGYGKPPKANQFKPGHSGNPRGRPKKPKITDFAMIVEKELQQTVRGKINGEAKSLSKLEAWISALSNNAIRGNMPAGRLLFSILQRASTEVAKTMPLSPEDEALLTRLLENE